MGCNASVNGIKFTKEVLNLISFVEMHRCFIIYSLSYFEGGRYNYDNNISLLTSNHLVYTAYESRDELRGIILFVVSFVDGSTSLLT